MNSSAPSADLRVLCGKLLQLTFDSSVCIFLQTLRGDSVADAMLLVKGTLDVLVLKTLTWGPMHGFEITSWLEQQSGGRLDVEDSALYQALRRLEDRGLVDAEWGVTDNNRKARYYRITSAGRAHLRAETSHWVRYAETVTGILSMPARSQP